MLDDTETPAARKLNYVVAALSMIAYQLIKWESFHAVEMTIFPPFNLSWKSNHLSLYMYLKNQKLVDIIWYTKTAL